MLDHIHKNLFLEFPNLNDIDFYVNFTNKILPNDIYKY